MGMKYTAAMRQRRRDKGLCVGCGERPPRAGIERCDPCSSRGKELHRQATERRIRNRECTRCRTPLDPDDNRTCKGCRRSDHEGRVFARENGLCGVCWDELEGDGHNYCRRCRERNARSQGRSRRGRRTPAWPEA